MKRSVIAAFVLLTILPLARVAATFHVFSETIDEGTHISSGLEWLHRGTYGRDPEHPPLARVLFALPGGDLERARAANLVFLLIAIVVVAQWSAGAPAGALLAVAIFGALPPVLGHAGLATTDAAAMAMTLLALFAFSRWLDRPTWINALSTAIAIGLGVLSKFSFVPFFGAAAIVFLISKRSVPRARQIAPAIVVAALVVWSGYRFAIGTMRGARDQLTLDPATHAAAEQYSRAPGYGWVRPEHVAQYRDYANVAAQHGAAGIDFVDWAKAAGYPSPQAGRSGRDTTAGAPRVERLYDSTTPIPAPLFWIGLDKLRRHSASGHAAFLLGHYSNSGWWYYFPVVFVFKTPIAFIVLAIAGMVILIARGDAEQRAIALAPLAMLIPAMVSRISIGIRHILPIYPFLAICAAVAAMELWRRKKWIAIALLAWFFIATAIAHPDYMAYFNELAGSHPENIAVDSNLDWGQDIRRLADDVRRNHISHLYVNVFGDWQRFHMPAEELQRGRRVTGWVAVSEMELKFGGPNNRGEGYEWLDAYRPVRRIGKSIRLYYIAK